MLKFKATDEQAKQIAVNAIKASTPMGMGFLHYNPDQEFPLDKVIIRDYQSMGIVNRKISLDYVGGRMVKLNMVQRDGTWQVTFPHEEPDPEYQSWVSMYPTTLELVKSVPGVEIQST